jgi:hypothetical protein
MSKRNLLLVLIIAVTIFNLSSAIFSELFWATYSGASSLLIQATGFIGPALSSECTATRNPVLESICSCLGDLPGGYCYHLSCGIVGVPVMAEQPNQIEIARK